MYGELSRQRLIRLCRGVWQSSIRSVTAVQVATKCQRVDTHHIKVDLKGFLSYACKSSLRQHVDTRHVEINLRLQGQFGEFRGFGKISPNCPESCMTSIKALDSCVC